MWCRGLIFLCFLLPFQASADWFHGSASRAIDPTNFDKVRTETIKKAIANAALQGQSLIQAEDIVLDGLLQSSKTVLRSKGQIRRVEILDEFINEGILTVMVRADIAPSHQCEQNIYSKRLLNTQFTILNPIQASVGALFELGEQTTKRFAQQLNAQTNINVSATTEQAVFSAKSSVQMHRAEINAFGSHLALQNASQFILFGYIRDMSLFEQVKDQLLFDDVTLRRNFTIQIYLYDAIANEVILTKSYHGEGNWTYPMNHLVDTNNSEFWRSDYGRSVLHTINSAVTDISDVLGCQQTYAHIIDNFEGQVVINIGKRQGVKVGDEFDLINVSRLQGADGQPRLILTPNPKVSLNVQQVNLNSSVLSSNWINLDSHGQLLNLVSPRTLF